MQIQSATSKTSARSKENNASLITIESPSPKQNPTQNYYNRDPNKNNIDPANTDKTKKALVACPFLKRRGYRCERDTDVTSYMRMSYLEHAERHLQRSVVKDLPLLTFHNAAITNFLFPFRTTQIISPPDSFPMVLSPVSAVSVPVCTSTYAPMTRPPPLMSIMTKPPVH